MSMHKVPLTELEEQGLIKHHLPVGTPSQLSDCFRHGIAWALSSPNLHEVMPSFIDTTMDEAGKRAIQRAREDGCQSLNSLCYAYAEAALSAYEPDSDGMCNENDPSSRCICREEFGHRVCGESQSEQAKKFETICPVSIYGTIEPSFKVGEPHNYTSGSLKYFHFAVGKQVKVTVEVLEDA